MTAFDRPELADTIDRLDALQRLGHALGAAPGPDEMYRLALQALERSMRAGRSALLLFDQEGVIRFRAWNGLSERYRGAVEGHMPWAPNDPDPHTITIEDSATDPAVEALRDVLAAEGIGALAYVPLAYRGRLLGTFMAYYDRPHPFSRLDTVAAETIASDVAFALGRLEIEEELRSSREQLEVILQGVADGITVQDPSGNLMFANAGAARLIGFEDPAELVATPLAEVMSRFEVMDGAGDPFPLTELPGRRALLGERVEEIVLGYRILATGEERWSLVSAMPVLDESGRVRFAVNIFRDVTERRRTDAALRTLAEAGEVLGSSLDLESTLATFTGLLVPALADWCIVDMLDPDGTIRMTAAAHRDPARTELIRELRRRFPPDWSVPHPITRVLATGRPELATSITPDSMPLTHPEDPDNTGLLERLGLHSHVVLPLVAKGRVLGALSLVHGESGRSFSERDLPLTTELAGRAAVAVENAGLFAREQTTAHQLRLQKSLLEAQTEASAEGIVVTTLDRRIVSMNRRYADVWKLPEEAIVSGSHARCLEVAAPRTRDPEAFLARVDELYANPEEEALDTIELIDGRTFERFTRPFSGDGTFYGRIWFYRDVTEARRTEAAQRFLAEASDVLNASLAYEETFMEMARLAVPTLADACLVYLRQPDGGIERVAAVHPEGEHVLAQLSSFRIDPDADEGVPNVIRSGLPQLREDADARLLAADVDDPERLAALLEPFGFRSWMCVPLWIGGDTSGAIAFASATRSYTAADLELAMELGRRAGIAVHNARLYGEAEAARVRLAFLAQASEVLSGSLDHEQTLTTVAQLLVPDLADWAAVDILDENGEIEHVAVAHVDPDRMALAQEFRRRYPRRVDDPGGAPEVIRTGQPQLWPEVPDEVLAAAAVDDEHLRMMRALEIRSFMIVPLIARGRVLGALTLVSSDPARPFTEEHLPFARDVARRAALALDNSLLFKERSRIAETLQRSLLPPELPPIPRFHVAARYQPAAAGTDVGGDFYDLFEIGDDRWAIVIGDVCGKGVDAAALTGLTRYTIRATALQDPDPRQVIEALNDAVLLEQSEGKFCTVVYATLHVLEDRAELSVTAAGHPLPLVARAGGLVETVGHPGTLVGVLPEPEVRAQSVMLSPGDCVALFTDGIIERRSDDELFGEERVRAVLAEHAGEPADRIAEAIERAVLEFAPGGPVDDMALLVLKMND